MNSIDEDVPDTRPRAGSELALARERMDVAISEQDWGEAWKNLLEIARSRDDPKAAVRAMRELRETRYGLLTAKPTSGEDAPPIQFFEIVHSDVGPIRDDGDTPADPPPSPPVGGAKGKKTLSAHAGRHAGRKNKS